MPHHKSAAKRMRTSEKARQRNRAVKSQLKGVLKKLDQVGPEESEAALQSAVSALDRAAQKGVIPKRRADRKKSRLARRAAAPPPASRGASS
jgi:small subunit ribosomal protein S20